MDGKFLLNFLAVLSIASSVHHLGEAAAPKGVQNNLGGFSPLTNSSSVQPQFPYHQIFDAPSDTSDSFDGLPGIHDGSPGESDVMSIQLQSDLVQTPEVTTQTDQTVVQDPQPERLSNTNTDENEATATFASLETIQTVVERHKELEREQKDFETQMTVPSANPLDVAMHMKDVYDKQQANEREYIQSRHHTLKSLYTPEEGNAPEMQPTYGPADESPQKSTLDRALIAIRNAIMSLFDQEDSDTADRDNYMVLKEQLADMSSNDRQFSPDTQWQLNESGIHLLKSFGVAVAVDEYENTIKQDRSLMEQFLDNTVISYGTGSMEDNVEYLSNDAMDYAYNYGQQAGRRGELLKTMKSSNQYDSSFLDIVKNYHDFLNASYPYSFNENKGLADQLQNLHQTLDTNDPMQSSLAVSMEQKIDQLAFEKAVIDEMDKRFISENETEVNCQTLVEELNTKQEFTQPYIAAFIDRLEGYKLEKVAATVIQKSDRLKTDILGKIGSIAKKPIETMKVEALDEYLKDLSSWLRGEYQGTQDPIYREALVEMVGQHIENQIKPQVTKLNEMSNEYRSAVNKLLPSDCKFEKPENDIKDDKSILAVNLEVPSKDALTQLGNRVRLMSPAEQRNLYDSVVRMSTVLGNTQSPYKGIESLAYKYIDAVKLQISDVRSEPSLHIRTLRAMAAGSVDEMTQATLNVNIEKILKIMSLKNLPEDTNQEAGKFLNKYEDALSRLHSSTDKKSIEGSRVVIKDDDTLQQAIKSSALLEIDAKRLDVDEIPSYLESELKQRAQDIELWRVKIDIDSLKNEDTNNIPSKDLSSQIDQRSIIGGRIDSLLKKLPEGDDKNYLEEQNSQLKTNLSQLKNELETQKTNSMYQSLQGEVNQEAYSVANIAKMTSQILERTSEELKELSTAVAQLPEGVSDEKVAKLENDITSKFKAIESREKTIRDEVELSRRQGIVGEDYKDANINEMSAGELATAKEALKGLLSNETEPQLSQANREKLKEVIDSRVGVIEAREETIGLVLDKFGKLEGSVKNLGNIDNLTSQQIINADLEDGLSDDELVILDKEPIEDGPMRVNNLMEKLIKISEKRTTLSNDPNEKESPSDSEQYMDVQVATENTSQELTNGSNVQELAATTSRGLQKMVRRIRDQRLFGLSQQSAEFIEKAARRHVAYLIQSGVARVEFFKNHIASPASEDRVVALCKDTNVNKKALDVSEMPYATYLNHSTESIGTMQIFVAKQVLLSQGGGPNSSDTWAMFMRIDLVSQGAGPIYARLSMMASDFNDNWVSLVMDLDSKYTKDLLTVMQFVDLESATAVSTLQLYNKVAGQVNGESVGLEQFANMSPPDALQAIENAANRVGDRETSQSSLSPDNSLVVACQNTQKAEHLLNNPSRAITDTLAVQTGSVSSNQPDQALLQKVLGRMTSNFQGVSYPDMQSLIGRLPDDTRRDILLFISDDNGTISLKKLYRLVDGGSEIASAIANLIPAELREPLLKNMSSNSTTMDGGREVSAGAYPINPSYLLILAMLTALGVKSALSGLLGNTASNANNQVSLAASRTASGTANEQNLDTAGSGSEGVPDTSSDTEALPAGHGRVKCTHQNQAITETTYKLNNDKLEQIKTATTELPDDDPKSPVVAVNASWDPDRASDMAYVVTYQAVDAFFKGNDKDQLVLCSLDYDQADNIYKAIDDCIKSYEQGDPSFRKERVSPDLLKNLRKNLSQQSHESPRMKSLGDLKKKVEKLNAQQTSSGDHGNGKVDGADDPYNKLPGSKSLNK